MTINEICFNLLTDQERGVFEMLHGLGDGYSYSVDEVSKSFKITRERVREIEANVLRKLNTLPKRHPLKYLN